MSKSSWEQTIQNQIDSLTKRVCQLEKDLWKHENPNKFRIGQRVQKVDGTGDQGIVFSVNLRTSEDRCWVYSIVDTNKGITLLHIEERLLREFI